MAYVVEILDTAGAKTGQLDGSECGARVTRVLNGEWTLQVTYPIPPTDQGSDKSALLKAVNARLRVRNLNVATDYQTYFVNHWENGRAANGALSVIAYADHISIAAMSRWYVRGSYDFQNAPPAFALAVVLAYMGSGSAFPVYALGTCAPTANISVSIGWETVLSAVQKILAACGGEYDIDEANSELDVYASMGSATKYIHVRPGRNLQDIRVTNYTRDIINVVYGLGAGDPPATIAGARHVVYSKTSQTITVEHNKLVPEANCWITNYGVRFKTGAYAGTSFPITACAHGAVRDTVTVTGSITSVVAGDKFVIVDAADNEVDFLYAKTSAATYGVVEGVVRDTSRASAVNLVNTPFLDGTYAAGLCASWTKDGSPTVTENTNSAYVKYGTKSQRVQGAADGAGVSQSVTLEAAKYYRVKVMVRLAAGTVKVMMGTSYSLDTKTYDAANPWQEWSLYFRKSTAGALVVKVVQAGAGTSDFYVDAVQVAECPLDQDQAYTTNCEQLDVWFQAFDTVMAKKDPRVEYRCRFVDLNRMSPEDYPFDAIALGDTVVVSDDDLGLSAVSVRVKEMHVDIFRPETTEHTVSNL